MYFLSLLTNPHLMRCKYHFIWLYKSLIDEESNDCALCINCLYLEVAKERVSLYKKNRKKKTQLLRNEERSSLFLYF